MWKMQPNSTLHNLSTKRFQDQYSVWNVLALRRAIYSYYSNMYPGYGKTIDTLPYGYVTLTTLPLDKNKIASDMRESE